MAAYDERLLLSFGNRFLGFGSLKSPVWLIGPEPGGGEDASEVYIRASSWAKRGMKETEDLHAYHADLGIDWTRKIQPTWGALIKVLLSFNGKVADRPAVLNFQRDELGKSSGENCVLELCPLSSPSESVWRLGELGFSWLRSRADYEAFWIPKRSKLIREKVDSYKPKLVLFYGKRRWEGISGLPFSPTRIPQLTLARGEFTMFAAMPHPGGLRIPGSGAVNHILAEIGRTLRDASAG
jgi:hypothetical protein